MKIRPSAYAKPLFTTDFYEADIWGGRGGGGSHNMSMFTVFKMATSSYFRGFLVRAIQGQIRQSLWQDFKDRIDELSELNKYDYRQDFHLIDSKMKAIHLPTGNILNSKGFKASSGSQKANMKSLAGATHVFIEECEEVGEEEYNKLADSLRTNNKLTFEHQRERVLSKIRLEENLPVLDKYNLNIKDISDNDLIPYLAENISFKDEKFFVSQLGINLVQIIRSWNVPPKEHWLVKNYFDTLQSEVEGYYKLVPKGLKGHLSVFRTYKDNIKNLDVNTVMRFERYKDTNPKYYYSQIKGYCSDGGDNKVYYGWKRVSDAVYKSIDGFVCYGVDFGDTAPTTLVEVKYKDGCFYRKQMLYKPMRVLNAEYKEEIQKIKNQITSVDDNDQNNIWSKHKGVLSYVFDLMKVDKNIPMFCDPAQKGLIIELRERGYNAVQAKKDKAANINFINRAMNYYTESSTELEEEYNGYYLETDINKNPIDGKPKKGNDHAIEAAEYACRGAKDMLGINL